MTTRPTSVAGARSERASHPDGIQLLGVALDGEDDGAFLDAIRGGGIPIDVETGSGNIEIR